MKQNLATWWRHFSDKSIKIPGLSQAQKFLDIVILVVSRRRFELT